MLHVQATFKQGLWDSEDFGGRLESGGKWYQTKRPVSCFIK